MNIPSWRGREETPLDLKQLVDRLFNDQLEALKSNASSAIYAFRGESKSKWILEPTLARQLLSKTHDSKSLDIERSFVDRFRQDAWIYLGRAERSFLGSNPSSLEPPAKQLDWHAPEIWSAIAIARHYGVPTRLLDWTYSTAVAAYFAACRDWTIDGAIWWFDQTAFETVLTEKWNSFRIPTNRNNQIAIELNAFELSPDNWITKVHHSITFRRLEVQKGFFTACGRLDTSHDQVMEELDSRNSIARGRIIIRAELKRPLLRFLDHLGIHAQSLDYPGADLMGFKLGK